MPSDSETHRSKRNDSTDRQPYRERERDRRSHREGDRDRHRRERDQRRPHGVSERHGRKSRETDTPRKDRPSRSRSPHRSSSAILRDQGERLSSRDSERRRGRNGEPSSRDRNVEPSSLLSHSKQDRLVPSLQPPNQEQIQDDDNNIDDGGPNFTPSGLLAADSNNKDGIALKYHEPPESRRPKKPWRMYIFKDGKQVDMITLGSSQSAYLLGRDRMVIDIPLDHPSCSKQHAVIQFRQTIERNQFGDEKRKVRPYLIDLDSANGCQVNTDQIPPSRYFEIKSGDTIRFGISSREYVLIDEAAV